MREMKDSRTISEMSERKMLKRDKNLTVSTKVLRINGLIIIDL